MSEVALVSDLITKLHNEKNALKGQQELLLSQFHQVSGAIAMIDKLIQDEMLKCKESLDKELEKNKAEQENGDVNDQNEEQAA